MGKSQGNRQQHLAITPMTDGTSVSIEAGIAERVFFRNLTRGEIMDINIDWDGPLSLDQALKLHADSDHGLYQYYGDHPVYGMGVLLYIGIASKQTFGQRLCQHNWHLWSASPVEIYVGRLSVPENPKIDNKEVEALISLAERALLFSHSPGFNTANLNSIGHRGEDVRILNWGKRRSLFPEVSISRWESNLTVGHRLPNGLRPYSFLSHKSTISA